MPITINGTGNITGLTATGISAVQNLPAGTVLQVVNATTTTTTTTTSATYVATALTASITPKFSTSKVAIFVTGALDSAATNSQAVATIFRNTTNIGSGSGMTNIFSSAGRVIGSAAMTFVDSPATTSSTSYTVNILGTNGSAIVFPQGGGTSTITLMEIAG